MTFIHIKCNRSPLNSELRKLKLPLIIFRRLKKELKNNQLLIDAAGRRGHLDTGSGMMQPAGTQMPTPPGAQNKGIQNIDYKILKPGADQVFAQKIKYDTSIPDADKAKMETQMINKLNKPKKVLKISSKILPI